MFLLEFMMKSRWHSIVSTALLGLSLFVFPPAFVLVGAALSLVTLRHGALEGFFVGLIVLGLLYLVAQKVEASGASLLVLAGAFCLPVLVLSAVVKFYGNIRYGFVFVTIVAVFNWLVLYQITNGNPVEFWQTILPNNFTEVFQQIGISGIKRQEFINILSKQINGGIISGIALLVLLSIIIGRFWQSKLYNPGGFFEEYRALTIGKGLGAVAISTVVVGALENAPQIITDMKQFFVILFLFQGLAVLKHVVVVKKWPTIVSTVIYILLFVLPVVGLLCALLGIADNWAKFREKITA